MGGTQSAEHPVVDLFLTNTLNEASLRRALAGPANPPVQIDGAGRKGDNVLSLACQVGSSAIVKLVVDHGANIINTSSALMYKRTPFHIAIVEKQEHIAVMLWMRSEFVRAIPYHEDATRWFALLHATRNKLYYILWLMCVGIHAYTAFPLRVLNDLRNWTDLSYSKYCNFMRRAYQHAYLDTAARTAVLFSSFGLHGTVYVSGDRENYEHHSKNTQNLSGLWPYSFRYLNPVNFQQTPILSAPTHGRCKNCHAEQCVSNECVLLCYMGHVHQFKEFMRNGPLSQLQLGQSAMDPNHRQGIISEFSKFLKLINQTTPQQQANLYKLPSPNVIQDLLPNFVLPPPILLSTAIHDQYLCTRTKCFCTQTNPQQPQCFIYPPLLATPTVPLNSLTFGGYHNAFCNTLSLDQQQKSANLSNINPSILKSKSNVHSHDVIQLHLDYIRAVHRTYHIPQPVYNTTTLCPETLSPGFSVPLDYNLSRYVDGTTKPTHGRPKGLAEKATGFFGGIMDLATSAFSQEPKFQDGTKPTHLDQLESVIVNNIRYHSSRMSLDTKFTSMIVGEKRDHITPIRMTEESPDDIFSSYYPPGAPQVLAYEHTAPILDSSFTTTTRLQNRTKAEFSQVTGAVADYSRRRPTLPPTLYHPIPDLLSRKMADLTQPIAPISTKDPYQYAHSQTCLCGAHTTNIQPIPLNAAAISLNVDGKSLRIADRGEATTHLQDANQDNPFSSVLYAALTPHTSIIYRPPQDGLTEGLKTFDYGFPGFQKQFEELVPPLNPTNDISTTSNNTNHLHAAAPGPNKTGTAVCQQGAFHPSRAGVTSPQMAGDIIISPSQHISIVIPAFSAKGRSAGALYFVANFHRIMSAKFPHYNLLSQWHLFTTRVSGAVQRLAQRRLTQRLITSEINLLSIFLQDTRFLVNAYRQHFGDHLNTPASSGQLSVTMPYFLKQTDMSDSYLNMLEQYITLRRYRIGSCQYSPGSNILALFGNVQCDDSHDLALYNLCNPSANTVQGTFQNPHPGSSPLNLTKMAHLEIEERLQNRFREGAGVLTNVPTPLPPGFNPSLPIVGAPPPGTTTLQAFTDATSVAIKNFTPHYLQKIKEFSQAYPKLAQTPNGSILTELEQYSTALRVWENRHNSGIQAQNQQHPTPLTQPYSMVDNFMLDTFLSVVPNILRGFIQKLQNCIAEMQYNMNNPQYINIHRVNFLESIHILEYIRKQAIQLDQWLCLPEISPHFHTKTHQFNIRDPAQAQTMFSLQPELIQPAPGEQRHQLVIDPHASFTSSTLQPLSTANSTLSNQQPYQHQPQQISPNSAYPSTTTPQSQQSQQSSFQQPTQQGHQAVMTMQLAPPTPHHQAPQAVMTMQLGPPSTTPQQSSQHQQYSGPYYQPPQHSNNLYPTLQNQLYPAQPPIPSRPSRPTATAIHNSPDAPPPAFDVDDMAPPGYDLDGSDPLGAGFDPNYGAPPTYGTNGTVTDEYVSAPTFTYFDDQHEYERLMERQRREEEAMRLQQQQQQQQNQQLSGSKGGHLDGLFQDEHESAPSGYDLDGLPEPPGMHRTDSELEREYFYEMIKNEPAVVLALDDDYIAKIENNYLLLKFLKDSQPQIWTQLTNVHPHLIQAVNSQQQHQAGKHLLTM